MKQDDEGPTMRTDTLQGFRSSPQQRHVWRANRSARGSVELRSVGVAAVEGTVAEDDLRAAIADVVERHEILRTRLEILSGMAEPLQVIGDEVRFEYREAEAGALLPGGGPADSDGVLYAYLRAPGPIDSGLRATRLRSDGGPDFLVLDLPARMVDGCSLDLLFHAVAASLRAGGGLDDPIQYVDVSEILNELLEAEETEEGRRFWRTPPLRRDPALRLPGEHAAPADAPFRPTRVTRRLDPATAAAIGAFAGEERRPAFFLACWHLLLGRLAGRPETLVDTALDGRSSPELEPLIGPFERYLPIRIDRSGGPSFGALLTTVEEALAAADRWQNYFEWSWEPAPVGEASAEVSRYAFAVRRAPEAADCGGGARLLPGPRAADPTRYRVRLTVADGADGIALWIDHDPAVLDGRAAERLAERLATLAADAAGRPGAAADDLRIVGRVERAGLVELATGDGAEAPPPETTRPLTERVAATASRWPDRVAVHHGDRHLSYGELRRRVRTLARRLAEHRVGAEETVVVGHDRSGAAIEAILGILEAGASYLPVDLSLPRERLEFTVRDAGARLAVAGGAWRERLAGLGLEVVGAGAEGEAEDASVEGALFPPIDPLQAAYVLYTSGSTGRPKGVEVSHGAIANRVSWTAESGLVGEGDTVLHKTPLVFDASIWELFSPLVCGATVAVAGPESHRDLGELGRELSRYRATVLQLVPSLLGPFLDRAAGGAELASLERVFCGGERLTADLVVRVHETLGARVVNLYGPTEASIDATWWECPRGAGEVPIGRPLPGVRVFVADRGLSLVPEGAVGELLIGGVGLARGYAGRPDLTAASFVPDPFGEHEGERLYRTGDLVRWDGSGALLYVGRADEQVKLRGVRIEPGEIESVLREHPGVLEAVVAVRPGPSLAAYAVASSRAEEGGWHRLPDGLEVRVGDRHEADLIHREIFEDRVYLRHGVRLAEDATVLDVGANIGLFTLFVADRVAGARVLAFEPVPAVHERLRANVERYRGSGLEGVEIQQVALGRAAGEAELTHYPRWSGMSGLYADPAEDERLTRAVLKNQSEALFGEADELLAGRFEGETVRCRVRTLSEVIVERGIERVDLLKVDVEKAELDVLEGIATEDWPRIAQVVAEVHDLDGRVERIRELLEGHGFTVTVDDEGMLEDTGMTTLYATRGGSQEGAALPAGPGRLPRTAEPVTPEELRAHLAGRLPEAMMPSAVVLLPELPRLPSGKIDRDALPDPEEARAGGKDAARGPVVELIAGFWRQLLEVRSVGLDDDFFLLGGHSLLATRLVSLLRETFGIEVSVRHLFERPTVRALAERVERGMRTDGEGEPPPIGPVDRSGPLPLSFAQQRLWFIDQLGGDRARYNMPLGLDLSGALRVPVLAAAVRRVVARHEVLRTTFRSIDGVAEQVVAPPPTAWRLPVVDLGGLPEPRRLAEAERQAVLEVRRPFDLSRDFTLRTVLIRSSTRRHALVATAHHIASDGWSSEIVVREIALLYREGITGRPAELPELLVQYADFAAWQRRRLAGGLLAAELDHWRGRLRGAPARVELPADRPADAPAARGAEHRFELSGELSDGVKRLAREERATPFMVLLAAFHVLASLLSGQDDVVIGTDLAGRDRPEVQDLVGFFVDLLPIRLDLSGAPTFREILRQLRSTLLTAYAHQAVPFDRLVSDLAPERGIEGGSLFNLLFVMQNLPGAGAAEVGALAGALEVKPFPVSEGSARFDLTLFVDEREGVYRATWSYRADRFRPETAARMGRQLTTILAAVVGDPAARVDRIEIPERQPTQTAEETMQQTKKKRSFKEFKRSRPRAVDVAGQELVRLGSLRPDGDLPALFQPAGADVDLIEWAAAHRERIEETLHRAGAALFRGFGISSVEEFESLAAAVCPDLFGEYGDLPKEEEGDKIYHSTPYPPDKTILFHNESSHTPRWPMRQFFYSAKVAEEGGETPIVDCRELYRRLDPDLRRRFEEKGLLYVRNFSGFDVPWWDFFRTRDKAEVESYCERNGIGCEWGPDDQLRISQKAPAVLRHPVTGETTFFNQIQLHHASCLDPEVRESMSALFSEDRMPRNVYFGDGTPIDDSIVRDLLALTWELSVAAPWQQGDVMAVDNMLVAHARNPFRGERKIAVAMGRMVGLEEVAS